MNFFYFNYKELYTNIYIFFFIRILTFISSIFWIPLALLIIFLKPLIFIRIGHLNTARIGHLVKETNLYILGKRSKNKRQQNRTFDIFFKSPETCNELILKIFQDQGIKVFPRILIFNLFFWLNLFKKSHIVGMAKLDRDIDHLVFKNNIVFKFPEKYKKSCAEIIRGLGIPQDAKIVLLVSRDNAYLQKTFSKKYNYNDFRNVPIDDFKSSVEFLLENGYYVFRMGNVAQEKLNINSKKFIDYPFSSFKSPEMDLYLFSKCYFCISVASGLDQLAVMFKKPILYVNMIPFGHAQTNHSLIIFKKLYNKKLKRFMTYKEIMQSSLAHAFTAKEYEDAKVEIYNNDKKEILSALKEFLYRIQNSKFSVDYLSDNQLYFHSLWAQTKLLIGGVLYKPHGKVRYGFIAESFIKSNKDLFETN